MKQIIWVLAIVAFSYYLYSYILSKQSTEIQFTGLQFENPELEPSINIVYFQDASGSIAQNGVEIINSTVFNPYYTDTHRDIQLSFGIINNLPARKLITVELKAARFTKPTIPNWESVAYSSQNEFKRKYVEALQVYQKDSAEYFLNRKRIYATFRNQVDSAIAPYKIRLSESTDLVTAIKIADKVFNYSFAGKSANYLLLNSDGLDSYNRHPDKLKKKAEVVLINANGNATTSIDTIVTKSFQSTEQAIEFTLNNHN